MLFLSHNTLLYAVGIIMNEKSAPQIQRLPLYADCNAILIIQLT
jgi:hypothetical protein